MQRVLSRNLPVGRQPCYRARAYALFCTPTASTRVNCSPSLINCIYPVFAMPTCGSSSAYTCEIGNCWQRCASQPQGLDSTLSYCAMQISLPAGLELSGRHTKNGWNECFPGRMGAKRLEQHRQPFLPVGGDGIGDQMLRRADTNL